MFEQTLELALAGITPDASQEPERIGISRAGACSTLLEAVALMKATDLSSASCVWQRCIGKDGNFTVVVEEHFPDNTGSKNGDGDGSSRAKGSETASQDEPSETEDVDASETQVKRTEFKVWASLLSHWSPVFEKMVSSDNYVESKEGQVVIQDFSADVVEIFLRFLYCGVVEGSAGALVQVAALADKYQVNKLYTLCLQTVTKAMTSQDACEVFAASDHFQVAALRLKAMENILIHPREALKRRPKLSQKLLEEILDSGLLCVEDADLVVMLRGWGKNEDDGLQPFIDSRIPSMTRKPGEHSEHVLNTLWKRYESYERAGRKGAFVGYWVVVTLGPQQAGMGSENPGNYLLPLAQSGDVNGLDQGWIKWELPHSQVHIMGVSFSQKIPRTVSFQVLCSADGAAWHQAVTSSKQELEAGTVLPCEQPPYLVKSFKLEVLTGQLPSYGPDVQFRIHGILQTS